MDAETRRSEIQKLLKETTKPISGTAIARKMGVSRQVIVQDIALLRANNKNILSTNKGYMIYKKNEETNSVKRIVAVKHSNQEMKEELYGIVDAGARVLDVVVEHDIYGQITVDLLISSRSDVDEFVEKIAKNRTRPLKDLTGDIHYHTIEAFTKEALDRAEWTLKEKGFLIL